MIGQKRTKENEYFGTLVFKSGFWSTSVLNNKNKYYVYVEGSKEEPSESAIAQAEKLASDISRLLVVCEKYLENSKITEYAISPRSFILECVYSYSSIGTFDVTYGHDAEDWEISLHFRDNDVFDISLSH